MCVMYQRFVCCWSIIYPGDSVAKFTWRNSAYRLGSKCKLIIVSVYLFCFFGRVSSTLSPFALTILHCYTNCHVESVTPPSEVFCLLRVCYQNGSSDILLVEVAGFAPASTTTFKQLLRIYKSAITINATAKRPK